VEFISKFGKGAKKMVFGDSFKNIEWTILNGSNMKKMLKDLLDVLEGKFALLLLDVR
jgi:hypothetical protein